MAEGPQQAAGSIQAPARQRSKLALEFNADRSKAFRRARVHSVFVRILRVAFPVTAIGLFATYGIFMQRSVKISKGPGHITISSASISTEALIAHNPRYEGFDKQGGKFFVHAKTGEQDFGQKGPVRLKIIDGQMTDAAQTVTNMKASRGTLDTKTNVLELYERIEVVSQNGLTADLTRATVNTREGRITSDEPVLVHMPTGVVKGRTMVLEQKQKQITFDKGVQARLKQDPPKDKQAATAAGKAPSKGDTAPFAASDAPIDITAVKLFVDDQTKLAVFTGNVVAVQADSTLQTARLEVSYEGQAAGAAGVGGAPAKAPADGGASRIRKLISKSDVILTRGTDRATAQSAEFDSAADRATLAGNVVLTSGPDRQAVADRADLDNKNKTQVLTGNVVITSGTDRQATADRADLDNKNDTQLLTGNVVVTQLRNVLKGRRLQLDRKAGTMAVSSPAEPGIAKGRIAAKLYQAAETDPVAAAKKAAAAPQEQQKTAVSAFTMRSDPNQPIDIDSETLDVNDKAHTATFRGAVHAVQGEYTIRTEELVVTYSGEAGMAMGAAGTKAAAVDPKTKTPGQPGTQLQKVQATKRVRVTTADGRTIDGNSAEFDPKANIVTVVGDVQISQPNSSTLTAQRVELDMTSGLTKMEMTPPPVAARPAASPATASAAAGAAAPTASAPAPPAPKGRVQAVLFPTDKDRGKDKDGKDKADPKAAAAAPPPAAQTRAPASPLPPQQPRQRDDDNNRGWSGDRSLFEQMGQ